MEDIFNDPSYIHLKDISFKKAVQTLHDELHNLDLEVEWVVEGRMINILKFVKI